MPKTGPWKWLGGLGTLGLVLWKFKFIVLVLATKGKLLILGLTKASTFFSMLLAFGVYWTAWGWRFAGGLVLSIYSTRWGTSPRCAASASPPAPRCSSLAWAHSSVSAPSASRPTKTRGLGWRDQCGGFGAAVAALAAARLGGWPMLAAIAHTGAWIYLFNLLPVWQLDGNRGFAPLCSAQRWISSSRSSRVVGRGARWAIRAAHGRRCRALVRFARADYGRPRRAR